MSVQFTIGSKSYYRKKRTNLLIHNSLHMSSLCYFRKLQIYNYKITTPRKKIISISNMLQLQTSQFKLVTAVYKILETENISEHMLSYI